MTVRTIVSRAALAGTAVILALAVTVGAGQATFARTPPAAGEAPVEAGRMIAEQDCSSCHAIGPTGESPLEGAPRWRDLHNRFDVSDLAEALAEGIMVGHAAMPAKPYEPAEVQALIAYLNSLEGSETVTPKR
ncbi:MAG: cytochrome c [Caulobacter sp.]|nr:cytochrome c [Caulobacter sp.]